MLLSNGYSLGDAMQRSYDESRNTELKTGASDLFRAIAERGDFLVTVSDPEGRYLYVNPVFAREFLNNATAPEGTALPAGIRERNAQALAEGSPRQDEEVLPTPAGERVYLVSRIPLAEPGIPPRLLSVGLEITQRSRNEESMLASRELFKGILDIASDAIISIGEDQRIILFNQGAEHIFGYAAAEVIGEKLDVLIPDNFRRPHRGHLTSFRSAAAPSRQMGERGAIFGRRKDGEVFPAEASISRVEVGGRVTFTAILRDMSAARETEAAIKALNADLSNRATQLENANRELEAFSYSVSHDLRAPLRSIDGFAQVLLEDYADKLDDEGRDALSRVRAASQQMAQLIDDILDLSRLTRGNLRRRSVDLSAMARQVAEDLAKTQPERNVTFVIADGIVAHADPHLMQAVLVNLIGNSWKYTSRHASACIEFGVKEGGTGGARVLFIKDDGAGFDMAYADKLFGAFQRLHGHKEYPGSGVGLATVQRIIHKHGGEVWGEGAVEQGATFYFTLP
jgi:PAS domain S-box-containing protein